MRMVSARSSFRRPARRGRRSAWRRLTVGGIVVGIVAAMIAVTVFLSRREIYDLVIRDAEIVDGTGAAAFVGTVVIRGDRIAEVRRGRSVWFMPSFRGRSTIEAAGLTLTPGFIDTHSHADFSIGEGVRPIRAENFAEQGVTTIIVGNCGRSSRDIGTFARLVVRRGIDVNVASLVGLSTVRSMVMKDVPRTPNGGEVQAMCALVEQAMRAGALGASTGYAYVPGRFATEREIEAQLRVVGRFGGIHASHIRDEGADILGSLEEATRVSRSARVPVLISHLKIAGAHNCRHYDALLLQINRYARSPGSRGIFFDQYPYTASSSSLDLYLPTWFLALSRGERVRTIRSSPERLRADMMQMLANDGYSDFGFARVASFVPDRSWQGRTIAEIDRARQAGRTSTPASQLDLLMGMLERGGAQMVYENICEDVMQRIPRDLVVMVGSDSAIRYNDGTTVPHPRGWGTFPRYLRTFTRQGGLAWPEVIHRMTDLPAQVFGLPLRGRVAKGYFADLVLMDRPSFVDRATFREPFRRPDGLRYVIVNGQLVLESRSALYRTESVGTGRTPGRFLRPSPASRRRTPAGLVPPALQRGRGENEGG